jgi:hypothetical protein
MSKKIDPRKFRKDMVRSRSKKYARAERFRLKRKKR